MSFPETGDRILVLKQPWLHLILNGSKILEIRSSRLSPGKYYLGCRGRIYAEVMLGKPFFISSSSQWADLREEHKVPGDELPYRRTWGLPISNVRVLAADIHYKHPRGAVGIVKYRSV